MSMLQSMSTGARRSLLYMNVSPWYVCMTMLQISMWMMRRVSGRSCLPCMSVSVVEIVMAGARVLVLMKVRWGSVLVVMVSVHVWIIVRMSARGA